VLEPFGCDPALHDLAVEVLREAGLGHQVLLAAHGSFKTSVPSDVARHAAQTIAVATGAAVAAAFIDQDPQLAQATGYGADALCLPFFAAAGGHVTSDIPAALASAGFKGRLLPAIGTDPRVPALIARAVTAGQPLCQTVCRYKS
jgi:sirohydrochlorin ferrochelatase